MAITVFNRKISPYTQKDQIAKLVFGDQWSLTIKLPTPHVAGDQYSLGIDFETVLYPPARPLCAGTEQFTIDGDELTFTLKLATARLRDWVGKIRKPSPLNIQIVRIRDEKVETLLLDTLLALPSVFDGVVTVFEGDPLDERLDEKLDKPVAEGTTGQVLTIDENGNNVWADSQGGGEQTQADWTEDSEESPAYIKHKPTLATVATSGSYDDLSNKPDLTGYAEKSELATVATSGSYNDLDNRPIIPAAQVNSDFDESDSESPAYILNKPDLSVYAEKSELATVATSGSYTDLDNRPEIPAAQVQADYEESDSSDVAYIRNKPNLSVYVEKEQGKGLSTNDFTDAEQTKLANIEAGAQVNVQASWDESDSEADSYIVGKPSFPVDTADYFCLVAQQANSTIAIRKENAPELALDIEYSTNKRTWTKYTWPTWAGTTLTLANVGDKMYFRGDNDTLSESSIKYYKFHLTGKFAATGNIMSLLSKTLDKDYVPDTCFHNLFYATEGSVGLTSIDLSGVHASDGMSGLLRGNSSLEQIKVGFHAWKTNGFQYWVGNVPQSGTFICPADLDCSIRSSDYIPLGWTILRTESQQPDWDENDESKGSYIRNKPGLKPDNYLYFECIEGYENVDIGLSRSGTTNLPSISLVYSTDKLNWSEFNVGTTVTLANAGDRVYIRTTLSNTTFNAGGTDYRYFTASKHVNCGGSIASLKDKDCKITPLQERDFVYAFRYCSILTAPELPYTELANSCYNSMFYHTSLEIPPVLPATVMAESAYLSMFEGCGSLKYAPELPAMTLATSCYNSMFKESGLFRGARLPAYRLARSCYSSMYEGCASLQGHDDLFAFPAENCYYQMFYNSGIVKAPAFTLDTNYGYMAFKMFALSKSLTSVEIYSKSAQGTLGNNYILREAFSGCSNLTNVKVHFTGWSSSNNKGTDNWLNNVSAKGVFECPEALDTSTRNASRVPSGWIVKRLTKPQPDWNQTNDKEADYVLNHNMSSVTTSSAATYTVNAGSIDTPVVTVSSALTLSAGTAEASKVAYAEIVLEVATGASVTAGTNLTLVDAPEAGKRNVCVVRWSGGTAKLYVTIKEDLDESSSSN